MIGDVIFETSFEITRDDLVRYAGASGDFNPIHYRDDIATSVGLPGVLAHGMLTMGIAVAPVISYLETRGQVIDYGVRFTRPVVVPASGSARIDVVGTVAEEGESTRIDLKVSFQEQTVLGKSQVWVKFND